jgi:hypothetical protein
VQQALCAIKFGKTAENLSNSNQYHLGGRSICAKFKDQFGISEANRYVVKYKHFILFSTDHPLLFIYFLNEKLFLFFFPRMSDLDVMPYYVLLIAKASAWMWMD